MPLVQWVRIYLRLHMVTRYVAHILTSVPLVLQDKFACISTPAKGCISVVFNLMVFIRPLRLHFDPILRLVGHKSRI